MNSTSDHNKYIGFWASQKLKDRLKAKAEREGLTVSELLRRMVLASFGQH